LGYDALRLNSDTQYFILLYTKERWEKRSRIQRRGACRVFAAKRPSVICFPCQLSSKISNSAL